MRTYGNIWKISSGQGDDCTTGYLLDYPYFEHHYKMKMRSLSKQQVLDVDTEAIQQINFTENLNRGAGVTIFIIIEEAKKVLIFSNRIMIVF